MIFLKSILLLLISIHFEETMAQSTNEAEIIEKIDIGGISLIRAAAKNFKDVAIVPSRAQYNYLIDLLTEKEGIHLPSKTVSILLRRLSMFPRIMILPFLVSFNSEQVLMPSNAASDKNRKCVMERTLIRKGAFYGDINQVFDQLHGKAISYNNLIDLESADNLIREFKEPYICNHQTYQCLWHRKSCQYTRCLERCTCRRPGICLWRSNRNQLHH